MTATAGMRSPPSWRTRRIRSNPVSPGSAMSATMTCGRAPSRLSSSSSASAVESGRGDLGAVLLQHLHQHVAPIAVIVHDEEPAAEQRARVDRTLSRGFLVELRFNRRQGNGERDPALGPGLAAAMCPPCSSTSWRTRARPSPNPPSVRLTDELPWRKRSNTNGRNSRRDSLAGVLHDEAHRGPVFLVDLHRDGAAARRELDCVRQHVPHDLLHAVRVAGDEPRPGSRALSGS